ncbi:hypothetical protein MKW98_025623 [Papaver atlanticum]|uniref:Uncharacterized protein n=1 Tax=Papaver atlanticum TaxID=357466 RepID=A0AAD4XCY4_9MAGN|nr:hypothetical protein MKW98_025623 [Papaver atlanticum]
MDITHIIKERDCFDHQSICCSADKEFTLALGPYYVAIGSRSLDFKKVGIIGKCMATFNILKPCVLVNFCHFMFNFYAKSAIPNINSCIL